MDAPPIQYARTDDGVNIAYWTLGDGPPLVYVPQGILGHARVVWEVPSFRAWLEGLAGGRRLVYLDLRNTGLSDDGPGDWVLPAAALDIEAVVEATGLSTFGLFAEHVSGPAAIAYAAEHQDRVSHLFLWASYASYATYALHTPMSPSSREMAKQDPKVWVDMIVPQFLGDAPAALIEQGSALAKQALRGHDVAALMTGSLTHDATDAARRLAIPTYVMQRRDLSLFSIDVPRDLAATIPNARLIALPGTALLAFAGDVAPVIATIAEVLGGAETTPSSRAYSFRTLLFTDLESSTALTQALGDAKAQDILNGHNQAVRTALTDHGGDEVKHTGDGIFAAFSSAVAAVEASLQIQRDLAGGEVRVRIGLNAGEPIAQDDDYFGSAVQLAARVCDRAEPGQILVAQVVRDLCRGKTFTFADQGEATLKGFPEPVRLFAVTPPTE